MTPQELQEFNNLKKEVADLKALFFKDSYSNLEVFKKKVLFKSSVEMAGSISITDSASIADVDSITTTGGTAVIADGNHSKSIPDAGGTITITTKNGIITNIT